MLTEFWYKITGYLKPRLKVLWWSVKHGGKDNIPEELFIENIEKTMESLNESLKEALRAMPEDLSEEERQELFALISKSEDLEREFQRAKLESSSDWGEDEE